MKITNQLYIFVALSIFAVHVNAAKPAAKPTCKKMKGSWVNELGSVMKIKSISRKKMIKGTYSSPSGTSGKGFKLIGWINDSVATSNGNNAQVISFSVQWGKYGSITSWTGYCLMKNKIPTIKTIWNLVKSNSEFEWDHILTNSDTFVPK